MSRLLLTRPLDDSQSLAQLLATMGVDCAIAPMLEIQPVQYDLPDSQSYDGMVLTSRHALPSQAYVPLYVVGDQTAKAAKEAGLSRPKLVANDVNALITSLKELPPQRLLYLRGETVSADLPTALPKHEWQEVIAYRAAATPTLNADIAEQLKSGDITAVAHFSKRSAVLAEQALAPLALPNPPAALCFSPAIAATLAPKLWSRIAFTNSPDLMAMLTLITNHMAPK